MDAEELIAAGNTVLVSVRQRGVARISGVPTEGHYFNALVLSRSQGDPDRELSERAQDKQAGSPRFCSERQFRHGISEAFVNHEAADPRQKCE